MVRYKPKKGKHRPLTRRQRRFVAEYLEDTNGTQAAIRAGYSPKTARSIASELLTKPHIKKALRDKLERIDSKQELKVGRILQELYAIAFLDPRDFVEWDADSITVKESTEIPPGVAGAVKSIEMTDSGIRIKFHDKLEAIEKLGKYHRMWKGLPSQLEVMGPGGGPVKFSLQIGDKILPPNQQEVPPELTDPTLGGREIEQPNPPLLPSGDEDDEEP